MKSKSALEYIIVFSILLVFCTDGFADKSSVEHPQVQAESKLSAEWEQEIREIAGDNLPPTARILEHFKLIKPQMTMAEVFRLVGIPDADTGSGIHIYTYILDDANGVQIGTPDLKNLFYVYLISSDGEIIRDLLTNPFEQENQRPTSIPSCYGSESPLVKAAANGEIDLVRSLIDEGVDVNEESNGLTALMCAVFENHPAAVKLLVMNGAEVNVKSQEWGDTPLIRAAGMDLDMVEILIEAGADANASSDDGWNALNAAILNQKPEIVKILIENSAQFDENAIQEVEKIDNKELLQYLDRCFLDAQKNCLNLTVEKQAEFYYRRGVDLALVQTDMVRPQMERFQDAIIYLEKAMTLGPPPVDLKENEDPHFCLGVTYENLGRKQDIKNYLQKSKEQYQLAVDRNPENAVARVALGTAHYWLNDFKTAIRIYEEELKKHPDDPDIRSRLAASYSMMHDYPKAQMELEYILERHSKHQYTNTLSQWMKKTGKWKFQDGEDQGWWKGP